LSCAFDSAATALEGARGAAAGTRVPRPALTFLPLRRLSKLPRFLGYVRKIRQQLDASPDGLIGYSLLAKPLRSSHWTLSVREDAAALGRFVQESPHGDAMQEVSKVMSGFRSTGSAVPPAWIDGLTRGEAHARI
jgi:hypothetical protein